MATKDLYHGLSAAISLAPAARTASADGTGVDLQGFESALIVITTGTLADGIHTIDIQESDDNSHFTSVPAADLQNSEFAIGAVKENTVYEMGYIGSKRYIRVAVRIDSATTGGVVGANVLRGHGRHQPL